MENKEISEFGMVLLFIIGGILFTGLCLFVARLLRPNRPNDEKLSSYECGEDAVGDAWSQFNVRFYIIGLIFLLFEVEIVFLFPWATVFGQKDLIEGTDGRWGWFALVEAFLFVGILVLGLAYAWVNGFLEWVKPDQEINSYASKIPRKLYEEINRKYERSCK